MELVNIKKLNKLVPWTDYGFMYKGSKCSLDEIKDIVKGCGCIPAIMSYDARSQNYLEDIDLKWTDSGFVSGNQQISVDVINKKLEQVGEEMGMRYKPCFVRDENEVTEDENSDAEPDQSAEEEDSSEESEEDTSIDENSEEVSQGSRKCFRDSSHTENGRMTKPSSKPCNICKQSFYDASNLRRHVKAVHEKQKHECGKCHRKFTRIDTLKEHSLNCL
jgi:hypothetical protein